MRAAPALALSAILLAPAAPAAPARAAADAVRDVRHGSHGESTRVGIEPSQPVATAVREVPADAARGAPPRFSLDLPGIRVGRTREAPIPIEEGVLRRVRIGRFDRATTRVVLDLEGWDRHRLLRLADPERVVIDVVGRGGRVRRPGAAGRPALDLRPVGHVVVDAGHGGDDPGAVGRGRLREKDVTLRLAARENGLAPGQWDAVESLLTRLGVSQASSGADRLADPEYLDALAARIARGVERYRDRAGRVVAERRP